MADFANGVVGGQASLDGFLSVVLLCTGGVFGFVASSYHGTRGLNNYLISTSRTRTPAREQERGL